MPYNVRKAIASDEEKILWLYKKVSNALGGLARTNDEITNAYVNHFCSRSQTNGIQLIIEIENTIVAEIHCYKLEPFVFNHVLSELTIAVDPDFQGKGLGKLIFQSLLQIIEKDRNDILRVELIARESNQKAIQFYQKLGFVIEGRFEKEYPLQLTVLKRISQWLGLIKILIVQFDILIMTLLNREDVVMEKSNLKDKEIHTVFILLNLFF